MATGDMFDHVYDNTNWMKKNSGDRRPGTEKRNYIFIVVLSVLLSLLTNAVLGYYYFMKETSQFWDCAPVRNCSNSDLSEQWVKGNGRFYVFSSFNKTWNFSREHCQSHGGDLVIINNTDEKAFLAHRLCITGESNLYWTGTHGGNWEGQEQVNCATLKGNKQGDASCHREERSICEIPCL
ncbi:C-type lectin domain family 17, member A isoform X2 [Triplophysa rosa]|uniref:C-type lectin domain family 17, member A isoform X2 n=1 Tax=Triplophysa rosa TaxID=992332 RepID=UPI0025461A53|nr:C-type lectin domain family 17, member A isoform X2 [Triplophysa rosa]